MEPLLPQTITTASPLRPATRADLEDLPENVVGEIIDGTLYTSPRPRSPHAKVIVEIADDLLGPYQKSRGGPGGWWILVEPGVELPGAPEIVPDLAGWRQSRLPELPDLIQVVPDWVCEILSPSNRWLDIRKKRPFYARVGVPFMWIVDPEAQALVVSENKGGHWMEIGTFGGDERVRAAPFDGIELELAEWWRLKA
jgi:Uma2 family endonuclease